MWQTLLSKGLGKGSQGKTSAGGQGPLSERARQRNPAGCLALFFLVFLVVGCVFSYSMLVKPLMQVRQARDWVETPCVVELSEVKSHRSKDSTTYSVDIHYRYTFEGRDFHSSRYLFVDVSSSGYAGKAAVVSRYPPGKESTCYVNPSQPGEAVLERRLTASYWFGALPLVFVAVGGIGLTWAVRSMRRQGEGSGHGAPRTMSAEARPLSHQLPRYTGAEPFVTDDPVTLKPKQGPVLKVVATAIFAAFWNGIISVFVWQAIKSWGSSRGGDWIGKWFLPLFLVPFLLVGLLLLGLTVYYFLALFNPRVRLTLGTGRLVPGRRINIQWGVDGRLDVLEDLRFSLEGREEATYTRGTSTYTDKSVFAKVDLASITDRAQMRSGQAEVEIPPETIPSFDSDHNKIQWVIQVKGKIRRWPDIEDEYPVRLLPAAASAIQEPST